jgi:hypothetical protein
MGAPSPPGFQLDRTFFGLDIKDKPRLHDSLFNLLWAGEGRWDWDTLYHMPIWMRTFWIHKLNKMADDRKIAQQNAQQRNSKPDKVIKPPM